FLQKPAASADQVTLQLAPSASKNFASDSSVMLLPRLAIRCGPSLPEARSAVPGMRGRVLADLGGESGMFALCSIWARMSSRMCQMGSDRVRTGQAPPPPAGGPRCPPPSPPFGGREGGGVLAAGAAPPTPRQGPGPGPGGEHARPG